MGKSSFKSVFIVLLAFTGKIALLMFVTSCVVVMISISVQIVEAKRMLQEEKFLPLLDPPVSKLVNLEVVESCDIPCGNVCIHGRCRCVCIPPAKL
ncbi:hypothetical protein Bca4012_015695 [Brassica carinata]